METEVERNSARQLSSLGLVEEPGHYKSAPYRALPGVVQDGLRHHKGGTFGQSEQSLEAAPGITEGRKPSTRAAGALKIGRQLKLAQIHIIVGAPKKEFAR